ncbi:uncharacterized protein LOC124171082 [Ischnura elegans]|uniref:uncharacterized protein LOC124171071 n=1 Tax=Ischnura elegans TaxID=197161 RepID=UPI001ED87AAF|nr:uncharacterized protein LOC124171071 [Ischnura elegans]XP_046406182.1 uncharacterized protein LOC124171082 [Ischnura elegans]
MWMHRRSEEPAPTEITSYWSKPKLAGLQSSHCHIRAEDFKKEAEALKMPSNEDFLKTVQEIASKESISCQLSKMTTEGNDLMELSMHKLVFNFAKDGGREYTDFLRFAESAMSHELIDLAANETLNQSKDILWQELRYGRITASRLYDASRCKAEGSILRLILGATKWHETEAMKRGLYLENRVLNVVESKLKCKMSRCGLFLMKEYPALGASPDALGDGFVVEIKCPSKHSTQKSYLCNDSIRPKYMAQIQLQMLATGMQKGLFCLANESFEQNKYVECKWVSRDQNFLNEIIDGAMIYWKNSVYPRLFKSVTP